MRRGFPMVTASNLVIVKHMMNGNTIDDSKKMVISDKDSLQIVCAAGGLSEKDFDIEWEKMSLTGQISEAKKILEQTLERLDRNTDAILSRFLRLSDSIDALVAQSAALVAQSAQKNDSIESFF
jgi:hypothetical protein